MDNVNVDNEQLLLEAAEAEFLEKGYAKSRTTIIAKRAGVTHAMLHYYFKTKENLFEKVFRRKAHMMSSIMQLSVEQDLPFLDKIKLGVENHFDFLVANSELPNFIFSEVRVDDRLLAIFIEVVKEKSLPFLDKLQVEIDHEAAKGTIKQVEAYQVLLTILSLNAFVFISLPVISNIIPSENKTLDSYLAERKRINVDLVLAMFGK